MTFLEECTFSDLEKEVEELEEIELYLKRLNRVFSNTRFLMLESKPGTSSLKLS